MKTKQSSTTFENIYSLQLWTNFNDFIIIDVQSPEISYTIDVQIIGGRFLKLIASQNEQFSLLIVMGLVETIKYLNINIINFSRLYLDCFATFKISCRVEIWIENFN